jgi:membrane peptidoglycan carboxypeptidase
MASAYATLADDGVYHAPYFIEKVTDRDGKVLLRGGDKGQQRVSPQVARQAVSILRTVITSGTGTRANPGKWPTFGKTGTTSDFTDAWFVGATRQLAAAVWMGSPVGAVPMRGVGNVGDVFGGTYPARIFGQFMRDAMKDRPVVPFVAPDPHQIGNKQMGITTSTSSSTSSTLLTVGGDTTVPGETTTTTHHFPTTTDPNTPTTPCTAPPNWNEQQLGPWPC